MNTDQFNHAPAELFIYTGIAAPAARRMGSWVTYGLGSENQDLPGFVVLLSGGTDPTGGKACWGTRLSAGRLSGRAMPRGRRSDPLRRAIPRA